MAAQAPPLNEEASNRYYEAPNALYEVGFQKWKQQQVDIEAIDRKAFGLFTIASAALVAALTLIRLRPGDIPTDTRWLSMVAAVVFGFTVILLFWTISPRSYSLGPTSDQLDAYAYEYDDTTVRGWAGRMFLTAFTDNKPLLEEKSTGIKWALRLSAIELALLAFALLRSFY